ncbi:hypothetical protein [Paenibacillus sp. CMAA1364]
MIKRGLGLIIAGTFLLLLLASCSKGAESTGDSPRIWINYNTERYEGVQVYSSKPDGLISTNTFTDEDDYTPNIEIFIDSKTSMLYIQEGTEWARFEKK